MRQLIPVVLAIATSFVVAACATGERIDDPVAYLSEQIATPKLSSTQADTEIASGRCQNLAAQTVSGYGATRRKDILAVTGEIQSLIAKHGANHYAIDRLQWMPAARAGSRLEADVILLDCND